MDVAREARYDHSTLRTLEEKSTQRAADGPLRGGETGLFGVGRIAEQQRDTEVTDRGEARDVGATSVDGSEVEFEIARVHDDPDFGVKGQGVRARYRVGHRDELDVERPDLSTFPVGDFDECEVVGDLRLGEPMPCKAQRER